jgi:capsular polysaccharide transport system ATP-binding protein
MIILQGVTAVTASKKNAKSFLLDVDLILPSDRRIALLGMDREQTTAFMHLLSGLLAPRAGRVIRQSKVSFPVGFLGGFVPTLPVRENVAYLARLYAADVGTILSFMRKITDLASVFDAPYGQLPREKRENLAQILAYTLPFDTYLLLQQPKPPAKNAPDPTYELFQARRRAAGMIIPTRSKSFAEEHCDFGLVFEKGKLRLYNNLDEAFSNAPTVKETKRNARDEEQSDDTSDDVSPAEIPSAEKSGTDERLTRAERLRARQTRLASREKRRSRRRAAKSGDLT